MIIRGKRSRRPVSNGAAFSPSPQTIAKEIARAKYLARYFELECGHLGTIEEDIRFGHWRPKKYLHWCDYDGWVRLAPQKEKSPDSLEPLF